MTRRKYVSRDPNQGVLPLGDAKQNLLDMMLPESLDRANLSTIISGVKEELEGALYNAILTSDNQPPVYKDQLQNQLRKFYMHENGKLPEGFHKWKKAKLIRTWKAVKINCQKQRDKYAKVLQEYYTEVGFVPPIHPQALGYNQLSYLYHELENRHKE